MSVLLLWFAATSVNGPVEQSVAVLFAFVSVTLASLQNFAMQSLSRYHSSWPSRAIRAILRAEALVPTAALESEQVEAQCLRRQAKRREVDVLRRGRCPR